MCDHKYSLVDTFSIYKDFVLHWPCHEPAAAERLLYKSTFSHQTSSHRNVPHTIVKKYPIHPPENAIAR
jgi:hypothetical protein